MTFETDFLALMASTVGVESRSSTDGFGKPSWSSPTSIVCHLTYKTKKTLGPNKETVYSTVQLQAPPPGFLMSSGVTVPVLAINDRVALPDGTTRHILDVTTYTDDTGVHHQSCDLQ